MGLCVIVSLPSWQVLCSVGSMLGSFLPELYLCGPAQGLAGSSGWMRFSSGWTHRKSPILLRAAAYTNVAKLGRMWDYLQALPQLHYYWEEFSEPSYRITVAKGKLFSPGKILDSAWEWTFWKSFQWDLCFPNGSSLTVTSIRLFNPNIQKNP